MKASVLCCAVLVLSGSALAEEQFPEPLNISAAGLFVHASAGHSKASNWCSGGGPACDDTSTSLGGGFGLAFTPWLDAEITYQSLDELKSVVRGLIVTADGSFLSASLVASGHTGSGFSLYGRLGFGRWEGDGEARTGNGTIVGRVSASGTSSVIGMGIAGNINRNLSLRIELNRTIDVGDEAVTGQSDIDTLSLGAVWRF